MNYIFAFALGIGFAAGLRALTPPAVAAWAALFGWLHLNNSPFAFMGSTIAVIIFSLLAVVELIGDLRPQTPKRTSPMPLGARILTGGLCGACLCAASNQTLIIGAILGAVGGVIGAFAGYEIRRKLVAALNIKDIFIALLEDLVAIGLAFFFVARSLGRFSVSPLLNLPCHSTLVPSESVFRVSAFHLTAQLSTLNSLSRSPTSRIASGL
ncbi:MAG TPA: DUF4126 family protein [Chthoniobacterales bacterium]|nr:DUF4126 family protein [Chthoniobacterales bacterium]